METFHPGRQIGTWKDIQQYQAGGKWDNTLHTYYNS